MAIATEAAGALRDLGRKLGLDLDFDENGVCALSFDDDAEIVLEAGTDRLLIYSPLVQVDDPASSPILALALELAAYGRETGGCAIGLDHDERRLVMSTHHHTAGLDAIALENLMATFLERHRDVLSSLAAGQSEPGPQSPRESLTGYSLNNLHMRV